MPHSRTTEGADAPAPHEPATSKQRASIHREAQRLLDTLAPERPPARADAVDQSVRLLRSPGRYAIMQGPAGAVSVSWFPTADEALGDLQVIEWRGEVSIPGSAHRAGGGAVAVTVSLLHPVAVGEDEWEWRTTDADSYTTTELAAHCRTLLRRACGDAAARA